MQTTIKFNINTPKSEIEKVIEAFVKKYVVKTDRYSTEANSKFGIIADEKNGCTGYTVEGKRIESHSIELFKGYDEFDNEVWDLEMYSHRAPEFSGYVEKSEFDGIVTVKENEELVTADAKAAQIKKEWKELDQIEDDFLTEETISTYVIEDIEKEKTIMEKELRDLNIDVSKIKKAVFSGTAAYAAKRYGFSKSTIDAYRSKKDSVRYRDWKGISLAKAEEIQKKYDEENPEQYWVNKNSGLVLTQEAYDELVLREAKNIWDDPADDVHDDYDNFGAFLESTYESEDDFVPSDKDGNVLQAEEW